ncbi:hypothetical protein TWF696_006227 [Orbilia brochopaga]|uniref:Uncharacterized protein n=1 Tax=Orbilia brochopaga TaxID=3140254 RepID=A0AAV9UW77_9PEZI
MPSKASSSKVAPKKNTKSSKPANPKPLKSSEYVEGSDIDSDESMTDAPAAKPAAPKSAEKTSKKRNRDGSEKVNGASTASKKDKSGKVAAATAELVSKPVNGAAKKGKKVAVVELSSDETSDSESSEAASESAESKEEDDDSESESESSNSEDAAPAKKSNATFKLPLDKDVPKGYTPLDVTVPSSIPSSLEGKQVFLFTAPSQFDFTKVKKIKLHSGADGETVESGDARFTVRRTADAVSSSMKIVLPREGKKGYQLASIDPTAQYVITEAPPSAPAEKQTEKIPAPPPRPQPEGLRMRFMPAGYGEESDALVNAAVLPPMDLVEDGSDDEDEDMVMDDVAVDVAPVAETPKKSKKSSKQKSKEEDEAKPTEDLQEDVPEEPKSSKKSKKEKKEKDSGEVAKKDKKKKKDKLEDEDGKKEKKKKHKKDKAEA